MTTPLPPGYQRVTNGPRRIVITQAGSGRDFPAQRNRVGNYEAVPARTYTQMVRQYSQIHSAYPDYTWSQYLQEWSQGNVRPTAGLPERRVPESITQRPGGKYIFTSTPRLGELAMDRMRNRYIPQLGSNAAFTVGANEQRIQDNIDELVRNERRNELIEILETDDQSLTAETQAAAYNLRDARAGQYAGPVKWWLFYKGDTYYTVLAAGGV